MLKYSYVYMIVGHPQQWQFLKQSVKAGKLAHAYLFFGEEQVGKKALSLEFIKFLDCQAAGDNKKPCQQCRSCQDIQNNKHPDLTIIEPQAAKSSVKPSDDKKITVEKKEIRIPQIRELQWQLALHPYSAPFKAVIMDEVHLLNQEAASAFLKTLEEPRGNTIVILITAHPEMLLPTIISRVQSIKFHLVSLDEIERSLEDRGVDKKEATKLAHLSLGRPGLALDYLNNPEKLERRDEIVRKLDGLMKSNIAYRFKYVQELAQGSGNIQETLGVWLRHLRGVLLTKLDVGNVASGEQDNLGYSTVQLKNTLDRIQKTISLLSLTNVNPRLVLESLMLDL